MNLIALFVGFLAGVLLVARFHKTRLVRKKWAYPLLLASFPVYYWVFAVRNTWDSSVLQKEIFVGALFVGLSLIAYRLRQKTSLVLLASGYFGHAIYDVVHNSLFVNPGTPDWWPEFCGSIDALIGLYLVYLSVTVSSDPGSTSPRRAG